PKSLVELEFSKCPNSRYRALPRWEHAEGVKRTSPGQRPGKNRQQVIAPCKGAAWHFRKCERCAPPLAGRIGQSDRLSWGDAPGWDPSRIRRVCKNPKSLVELEFSKCPNSRYRALALPEARWNPAIT